MESRDTLLKRIDRLTRTARGHLTWERYAPVLAMGVAAVLIFMAGSFAGVWERIGDPWRLIALLAALGLFIRSLWQARTLRLPKAGEAARRVEHDSELSHRPFDTVRDAAAKTGSADMGMWDTHSRNAANQAASASPSRLRPALAPIDKFYLRFAVPAAVVLALMLGTSDSFERLRRSLSPSWLAAVDSKNAKFDAWIDPPDYTGRPPVYFKKRKNIEAPEDSELVARVTGIKSAPRLLIVENGKSRRVAVTRLGPKSFEARTTLTRDAKARWRIGTVPKEWKIEVKPDTAPDVDWASEPNAGKRDRLEFAYNLTDDYGATSLELEMVLGANSDVSETAQTERMPIDLPSSAVRSANEADVQMNLTKHKWAGRKVTARLIATDAKGQEGISETQELIVPDKIFIEPLAKAIIENRSLLLQAKDTPYKPWPKRKASRAMKYDWGSRIVESETWAPQNLPRRHGETPSRPQYRIDFAPQPVQRAALLLDAITDEPVGAYRDPIIFMGLKNVQSRIEQARAIDDLSDAPEDLWLIAMRAEFGPLGNAKEAMQAAEASLRSGIARRARKREIDTLFTRYDDAVDRYMQFLLENATESDEEGGSGGPPRNMDEIQKLLDAIEEANRLGDTEGARRALAQLAELLENMEIQLAKGGEGEGGDISNDGLSEDVKEALEDLADTLGKQRELRDETRDAEREQEKEAQRLLEESEDGEDSMAGDDGLGTLQSDTPKAADPEQLARDQKALQAAIDDLEEALRKSGTDMAAIPSAPGETGDSQSTKPGQNGQQAGQGSDAGEEQGQGQGQGESRGNSEDPNAQPGSGGGAGDPDGEEGRGTGGDQDGEPGLSPEQALDAARQAMAESEAALEGSDFTDASEAQKAAIDALRQAAESLIAQSDFSDQAESGEGREGQGNDPFGREGDGDGNPSGEGVEVPEKSDRQRARELLEELRERRSNQARDKEELDYLERLLERF